MFNSDTLLLVLCLWSCVATGLAFMFWKQNIKLGFAVFVLGKELYQIAHGELEVKVVNGEVKRTYKEGVKHA